MTDRAKLLAAIKKAYIPGVWCLEEPSRLTSQLAYLAGYMRQEVVNGLSLLFAPLLRFVHVFADARDVGFGVPSVDPKTPIKTALAFKDLSDGLRREDHLYVALLRPNFDMKGTTPLMDHAVFDAWKRSKIEGPAFARAIYMAACFAIVHECTEFFPPPAPGAGEVLRFGDVPREDVNRAMFVLRFMAVNYKKMPTLSSKPTKLVRYLTDDEVVSFSLEVRMARREETVNLKVQAATYLDNAGFDADVDIDTGEEFGKRIEVGKAAGMGGIFDPDGNSAALSAVHDFAKPKVCCFPRWCDEDPRRETKSTS